MPKTFTQIYNEVATAIQEKIEDESPISAEDFGQKISEISTGAEDVSIIQFNTQNLVSFDLLKFKEYLPTSVLNEKVIDYLGDTGSSNMYISAMSLSDVYSTGSVPSSSGALALNCSLINSDESTNLYAAISGPSVHISILGEEDYIALENIENWSTMTISGLIDLLISERGSNTVQFELASDTGLIDVYPIRLGIVSEKSDSSSKTLNANQTFLKDQLRDILVVFILPDLPETPVYTDIK